MSSPKLEYLLALENTKFNSALKTSQIKVVAAGKKMSKGLDPAINKFKALNAVGGKFALGGAVAGLAVSGLALHKFNGFMQESIELANIQDAAETKLAAVITATGGAAGFTAQQLYDYAGELQKITTYGDETTISAMAMLATFKNIKGDNFKLATKAAMNLSAMTGRDLQSSITMVGKALNDPVRGVTALSLAGVQFNTVQREMIKNMVSSGDVMGAQGVILGELKGQMGGVAETARETFSGMSDAVGNAFGDLKENVGFAVTHNQFFIEGLKVLEKQFYSWTDALEENGPEIREYAKQAGLSFLTMGEGILTTMDIAYRGAQGIKSTFLFAASGANVLAGGFLKIVQAAAVLTDFLGVTTDAAGLWESQANAAFKASVDMAAAAKKDFSEMAEGATKIQAARDALEGFRTTMEKIGTEKVGGISKDADKAATSTDNIKDSTEKYKEELVKINGVWVLHKKAVKAAETEVDSVSHKLDKLDGRTITVKIVEKALQKRALGGMIHAFKAGGKLAGYGGGDKIHALLEAGEFIIRKEAVAKFGSGLFNSLNNFQLPQLPQLPAFATGGPIGATPAMASATPTYNLTVNFPANTPLPSQQNAKTQAKMILDQLVKMKGAR